MFLTSLFEVCDGETGDKVTSLKLIQDRMDSSIGYTIIYVCEGSLGGQNTN